MSEAHVSWEGPLRIVALADLHCGHKYGLTPREWWVSPKRDKALRSVQEELFRRYEETVIKVGTPVDAVFGLGDFIAGEERADRGVELIEPDQAEQCNMAVDLLRKWQAKQYFLVRGSPYHGGQREEWEDKIAEELDAPIANELYVEAGGLTFNLRHTVGRTSIPHGVGTPLAREWLVRTLMAARNEVPKADILLRGHTHYYAYVGGPDWMVMNLPALCAGSGKLARRAHGWTNFGLVVFEVEGGEYAWRAYVAAIKSPHAKRLRIERK